MSSLKLQAGTSLGEEGSASDTRRCFRAEEEAGKGALNEKVDVEGTLSGGGDDPAESVDVSGITPGFDIVIKQRQGRPLSLGAAN